MKTYYIVLGSSIVLAVLLHFILHTKKTTWQNLLSNSIISAIIGATVPTLFYIEKYMGEVISLTKKNKLTELEDRISSHTDNNIGLSCYKDFINRINTELLEANNGIIKLTDEDEVIDVWKKLFDISNGKSKEILATNIINPNFWLSESSFSKNQLKIQQIAIQNDFNIKRILIYDTNDKNKFTQNALIQLANQQNKIGVKIKFLSIDDLHSNSVFSKNKLKLKDSEDIVVSNVNLVLLTISDPKTKKIKYGYISDDRITVDIAIDVYRSLWDDAKDKCY
jgi:hypothetical protein